MIRILVCGSLSQEGLKLLSKEKKFKVDIEPALTPDKLKEIIPNIYLKIAGSGKELEKMKKISRKLNLDNYVKFYGLVSDQKMQELYLFCYCDFLFERCFWICICF